MNTIRVAIACSVIAILATLGCSNDGSASRGDAPARAAAPAAADAWVIGPWTRPLDEPVIAPRPASTFADPMRGGATSHWEALHTFNPAAVVRGEQVCVLYRAEDDSGAMAIGMHTSRLGLARSDDGLRFTRGDAPVLFPADDSQRAREWEGGCEDPRVVEAEDGTYVLTYTQWNRQRFDAAIATSPDLVHWTKHGPAFAKAAGGAYANLAYKSAGIVTRVRTTGEAGGQATAQASSANAERLVAAKINGVYWMYWGEGAVHLATSPDLIDWTPVEDARGKLVTVLGPRAGKFDSGFPEVGPPPVLTAAGIVLIYNGKNAGGDQTRDKSIGANAYSAGEALFAADNPARLLARTDAAVFTPEKAFEKTGQYAAGTVFAEGLVRFRGKWVLFYGCADSLVGVADGVAARADTSPAGAAK